MARPRARARGRESEWTMAKVPIPRIAITMKYSINTSVEELGKIYIQQFGMSNKWHLLSLHWVSNGRSSNETRDSLFHFNSAVSALRLGHKSKTILSNCAWHLHVCCPRPTLCVSFNFYRLLSGILMANASHSNPFHWPILSTFMSYSIPVCARACVCENNNHHSVDVRHIKFTVVRISSSIWHSSANKLFVALCTYGMWNRTPTDNNIIIEAINSKHHLGV